MLKSWSVNTYNLFHALLGLRVSDRCGKITKFRQSISDKEIGVTPEETWLKI